MMYENLESQKTETEKFENVEWRIVSNLNHQKGRYSMNNRKTKPAISQYIVNRFKDIAGERARAIRNVVDSCDEVKRTKMRELINGTFRKWSAYHYNKPYWFEDAAFHCYFEVVALVKTYVDPGFDQNYRMWLY